MYNIYGANLIYYPKMEMDISKQIEKIIFSLLKIKVLIKGWAVGNLKIILFYDYIATSF